MKRWAILFLAAFAFVGKADPLPGDVWSPADLSTVEGAPLRWSPKRVTVISFYAFWCSTWQTQEPWLEQASTSLKGLPVDFLTISTDGRWKEVALGKGKLPLALDPGGAWSKEIGIDHVPTTVVVDASGKVKWVRSGTVRPEDISHAVRDALSPAAKGGNLYLTFDDFPPKVGGDDLLDTLRSLHIHATFFCICSRLTERAELVQRALAEGNELECHSWDHDAADPQLVRCQAAFKAVLGRQYALYRPPGSAQIRGVDLPNFNPYDYSRPGESELVRRILFAAEPNETLEFHAGVSETVSALPKIVERLQERGFNFLTLENRPKKSSNKSR